MADSTIIPHQSLDPSSSAATSMDVSRSTNSNSSYHEVFINHYGKDVKKKFASHLYHRLLDYGIRAFLDLREMRVGNRIDPQLEGAIATASVNVAIFSPGYARSKWCLNELVQMNNRKNEAPIIPIFYDVEPCDLRMRTDDGQRGLFGQILGFFECPVGQILRFLGCSAGNNGVYAEAFRRHVKKRRHSQQLIAGWKKALYEVSEISGLELTTYNGDEGQLLTEVIQLVIREVQKLPLCERKALIALDGKLQDLENTIASEQRRHSKKAKVVGIVGSAGVGKTALAIEFFHRKRSGYDKSYFLEDVRHESSSISLQINLYRGLTLQDLTVGNIAEGRRELSRRLSGCKALIILDNVDDATQLHALFSPLKEVLSDDSLILLTSRNWDLLSRNGVSSVYKLSGLDREQSQILFCKHAFQSGLDREQSQSLFDRHAFQECRPPEGFDEVVTKFLDACDGLPLSLEAYGSHLSTQDLKSWEGLLKKISALVLLPEIKDSLKISYDSLDPQEKEVFLDIACFLIEEHKDEAISVWDGSGWAGSVNLQNLELKCIVQIDSQNRIKMHNHLRDLGRTLAEDELPKYPRRLWRRDKDIFHYAFIQPSVRGINRVEGVSDKSFLNSPHRPPVDMTKLQLLTAEGDCLKNISELLTQTDQLVWLCWNKCRYTSLPSWLPIQKLRALRMSGGELETTSCDRESVAHLLGLSQCVASNYGGDSGEVQHISLNGCSISEFLSSCPLQLEHLDLQGTKIKEVSFPEGFCPKLKHLNLSFCRELREVGALPTGLISLNLEGSTALKKISGLPGLTDLRRLDISGCHELEELSGLDTLPSSLEVKGKSECRKLCKRLSKGKMKLVATNF